MKKNNMAAKYILLALKGLFYLQTLNVYFRKQTVKLKKDFAISVNFLNFLTSGLVFVCVCFKNGLIITQRQNRAKNCWEKQQKLPNVKQKGYFKNEREQWKHFDHGTDNVMSLFWSWKKYQKYITLLQIFSTAL